MEGHLVFGIHKVTNTLWNIVSFPVVAPVNFVKGTADKIGGLFSGAFETVGDVTGSGLGKVAENTTKGFVVGGLANGALAFFRGESSPEGLMKAAFTGGLVGSSITAAVSFGAGAGGALIDKFQGEGKSTEFVSEPLDKAAPVKPKETPVVASAKGEEKGKA